MKQYISEERAIFEDMYQGQFSKKLAEFAIRRMMVKDPSTNTKKRLVPTPIEEVQDALKEAGVELPEEYVYTSWYLFNMAKADYVKTFRNDEQRATFVEETILDPDGCPENVLDCFVTKMRNAGVALHWERFI